MCLAGKENDRRVCTGERVGSDNGTGRGLCMGRNGEGASREGETSGGCEMREISASYGLCCHRADNKTSFPPMFASDS